MGYTQWGAISTSHKQKSGRFVWMGVRIVEILVPQVKGEREGGNPPSSLPGTGPREKKKKRRTGRRGTRASRVGRSTVADRERRGLPPRPPHRNRPGVSKTEKDRLRRFIWAASSANRLAKDKACSRLIRRFPDSWEPGLSRRDIVSDIRRRAMSVDSDRGRRAPIVRDLERVANRWWGIARHASRLGVPAALAVDASFRDFLAFRSSSTVGFDEILARLPRPESHRMPPPRELSGGLLVSGEVQDLIERTGVRGPLGYGLVRTALSRGTTLGPLRGARVGRRGGGGRRRGR